MTVEEITQLLESAALSLLKHQSDFFAFTSETDQREWNISHHYANEVHSLFQKYHCDVDVAKPNFKNKRPDIIIHRRGTHHHNLLVIEVKRNQEDVPGEIEKILTFWFDAPLCYQFGAVVVINDYEKPMVKVIENQSMR